MMQISEHYLPYAPNTFIVVVNAMHARVLKADDRQVKEVKTLETNEVAGLGTNGTFQEEATSEAADLRARHALYETLNEYLAKAKFDALILCAPEVYNEEIRSALSEEVLSKMTQLVPKNLASLPIDAIIRILQEKQP